MIQRLFRLCLLLTYLGLSIAQGIVVVNSPGASTTATAPPYLSQKTVIAGQTLTAGGVITVSTRSLSLISTSSGYAKITEIRQSAITSAIIAGQSLTADGSITVGGDVLSLTNPSPTSLASATGTARFTVPTGKPFARGQNFSLSWENTSNDVDIFLMGGMIPNSTSKAKVGPGTSPLDFFINSILPLGPYYFELIDWGTDGVPNALSQQYSLVDVSPSSLRTTSSPAGTRTILPTLLSASANTSSPHTSLTTGAKAGIGLGATLGGILILSGIAWACYRRGQRNARIESTFEKAELSANERKRRAEELESTGVRPREIDGNQRFELSGGYAGAELG